MSCGGITNSCGSMNPWNYQVTRTTESMAWSATVLGVIAVSAGVLTVLASSGVHLGAFNCMSRLTFGGGITLTGLGGVSSLLGSSWLILRFKQQLREEKAAVKIQSVYRGYVARQTLKQLREERRAAVKIQSVYRGYVARQTLKQLREENAFDLLFPDQSIPALIANKILSYLRENELGNCALVSRVWCHAAHHTLASRISSIAFGKTKWETYFGDVGEEPSLPDNIWKILKSPCPFWPEKGVEQTHILVLIPASVNGELLTLESLGELVKQPKNGGHSSKYEFLNLPDELKQESGEQSYWVLMTKNVLPGTRAKGYEKQKEMVAAHQNAGYVVPKARGVAVCLFMHHVSTGKQLYGQYPMTTYTRCEELLGESPPVIVGDFNPGGLSVVNGYPVYSCFSHGMGAVQRFS